MSGDHYETLGVDRNASPDQIKEAYRDKAKVHHPDHGGDKKQFQLILAAYDVLSDEEKRGRYDRCEKEKSGIEPILAAVRSMFDSAFGQDKVDPLKWIRDNVDSTRSQNQDNKRSLESNIVALEKKLKRFKDSNANTKNQVARDLMIEMFEERIEDTRSMIAGVENQIQLGTDILAFLDGLKYSSDSGAGIFSSFGGFDHPILYRGGGFA